MLRIIAQFFSFILVLLRNLIRPRATLIAENLILRQQLEILSRTRKAKFQQRDRLILILLSRLIPHWKDIIRICQPETLLRWFRDLLRMHWRWKSRKKGEKGRISIEIKKLIIEMKRENILWGAERIRGELLKLGIKVSKRTIQKIIDKISKEQKENGQSWSTFLKNHLPEILACDFFTIQTVLFKTYYVFFVIKLETRELLHIRSTFHPNSLWVKQQIKEATPFLEETVRLIHDRDKKFSGIDFKGLGIKDIRLPPQSPYLNGYAERFVRNIKRECLDQFIILNERHLIKVLKEYKNYYNNIRPHQGIEQNIPSGSPTRQFGSINKVSILGGLHHHYYRKAA